MGFKADERKKQFSRGDVADALPESAQRRAAEGTAGHFISTATSQHTINPQSTSPCNYKNESPEP